MERTGQLAKVYYGFSYQVLPSTPDRIKVALLQGNPVIVPVMTHALQNPNYGSRSVYHELLIKGYTADGVIANDPGVSQGKNWFYSWGVISSAIAAQTPSMGQGSVMLVLHRA